MPGRDLPDLDQRLRRLPAALAVDAPAGLAERIAHQGRRRRWLRRATAAAAVVVLLGGAAVTRSVLGGQPAPVLNSGLLVEDASPGRLARGRWQALPPLPATERARRLGPAVVWTGRQLIVWGGASRDPYRTRADGAAYDPGTGRWTPLPPAPEGQWLQVLDGTAVWTGREMLVWGGLTIPDPEHYSGGPPADGAAYDPARRTWRRLPPLPAPLRSLAADHWTAWTGRELLVGGVQEAGTAGEVLVAGYDPAANRWRRLPQSPELTGGRGHLLARTALWAGDRLLVWNHWSTTPRAATDETGAADRPDSEPDGIDLWAYDPAADRWTALPAPPREVGQVVADSSMAWTGREVVIASAPVRRVAGRNRRVAQAGGYDPDRGRWTPMASLDRPTAPSMLTWAGAAVVEPLERAVYDPATDRWSRLPAAPARAGGPPQHTGSLERSLLWTVERASGAVQVYVLVPGSP